MGSLSGLYSRRISRQHRFVYEVIPDPVEVERATFEGAVKILRMWTRYKGVR